MNYSKKEVRKTMLFKIASKRLKSFTKDKKELYTKNCIILMKEIK